MTETGTAEAGAPPAGAQSPGAERVTLAPAKVNLTLRVRGRRADGYHELESLVAFAPFGDRLTLTPGGPPALAVSGPTADGAGPISDNLVLRAVAALAERVGGLVVGRFDLHKELPSGAGLGGGSADAAAALRLVAGVNGIAVDDARLLDAARVTGADVPVCVDPRPRVMRGIGERLSAPLRLPPLGIVILHPGFALPTGPVFKALGLEPGEAHGAAALAPPHREDDLDGASEQDLLGWLAAEANDLQAPAIATAPRVAAVLSFIAGLPGCRLARMSGSGSACFGLFDDGGAARQAAAAAARAEPSFWVRAGTL